MEIKSINRESVNKQKDLQSLIKSILDGKHVYILIHRIGCPPCEATRPEWLKIGNQLSKKHTGNNNILIADVEEKYIDGLQENDLLNPNDTNNTVLKPYIGDIDGFPTMKLIKDKGNTKELYENSNISKKDRSVKSFLDWIESSTMNKPLKSSNININNLSSPYKLLHRLSRKTKVSSNSNRNSNRHKKQLKRTIKKGGGKTRKSRKSRKIKIRKYKK